MLRLISVAFWPWSDWLVLMGVDVVRFYLHGECVSTCPDGYFESTLLPASSSLSAEEDFDLVVPEEPNHVTERRHDNGISSSRQELVSGGSERQCLQCHRTCSTCVGQLSSDCVLCSDGLLWSHGRCLVVCDYLWVLPWLIGSFTCRLNKEIKIDREEDGIRPTTLTQCNKYTE